MKIKNSIMKTKLIATILALFIVQVSFSQERETQKSVTTETKSNNITDTRDGKTYNTVKIDTQTWMTENLNYSPVSGSWCYENNTSNCAKYGRLYNWETAKKA